VGRFDIERLLKDLGEPDPSAPREPAGPDLGGDDGLADISPTSSMSTPTETGESAVSPRATSFATRPDVARPPDFRTGDGLGREVDPTQAISADHMRPTRPDDALRDLFVPGQGDGRADAAEQVCDLGALLHARGDIDATQLETLRRLGTQSPERSASTLLLDLGVAEHVVQSGVAEIARIPFTRVTAQIIDAAALKRLGSDFCLDRLVVPLSGEGSRTIVGTTNPDDVFLLDDVRGSSCARLWRRDHSGRPRNHRRSRAVVG
jgi:hypothetical protein